MHGGALGSGAPRDNRNAVKHGFYTREAMEERRRLRDLVRQSRRLVQEIGVAPQPAARQPVARIERSEIRGGVEASSDGVDIPSRVRRCELTSDAVDDALERGGEALECRGDHDRPTNHRESNRPTGRDDDQGDQATVLSQVLSRMRESGGLIRQPPPPPGIRAPPAARRNRPQWNAAAKRDRRGRWNAAMPDPDVIVQRCSRTSTHS
jgi:hypothetical protein